MLAARLIGASRYASDVVGATVWPGMRSPTEQLASAVDAALGSASFAIASAEGARVRIPEAFGYGLAATATDANLDPFGEWSAHLRPDGLPKPTHPVPAQGVNSGPTVTPRVCGRG
jgi:hypothetical protein